MLTIAKFVSVLFGLFFIAVGILMLLNPVKANQILRKAGSTNLINYGEILIRMIPAVALIIYADHARHALPFLVLGWFMIGTSVVLLLVPKEWHHRYSTKSADILKPVYFRLLSPVSMAIGVAVLYNIF